MKIELKTKELERELNMAQQLVGRAKFDYLSMETNPESITIVATDYDNSFKSEVDSHNLDEGRMCVANRKLTDLVKLLYDEKLTIASGTNGRVTLKAGRASFKLVSIDNEMFPEQQLPVWRGFWKLPTSLMQRAIDAVVFAVPTTDSERFQMRCANLSLTPDGLRMITTDGKRIATFEAPLPDEPFDDFEALITDRALSGLAKLCHGVGELEIDQNKNHIFFRVGKRVLTVRKIVGTFPDVKKALIDGKPGYKAFSVNAAALKDVLRKANVLVEAETLSVKLTLVDDTLTVFAQSVNDGSATQDLEVENLFDISIEFMVNVRYVLEFLETVKTERVTIDISTPTGMLQLRPEDKEYKQRYILAPMRMNA